jgi:hypothetical protein
MYLHSEAPTPEHARFAEHPAWIRHQRCSPNFRLDAGSLCLYEHLRREPSASGKLMLIWIKTFIAPRAELFIDLLESFSVQFLATPGQVDWTKISLQQFLTWSETWKLDSV